MIVQSHRHNVLKAYFGSESGNSPPPLSPPPPPAAPPPPPAARTFTQVEVDRMIGERIGKKNDENKALLTQLEEFRSVASLTKQQKDDLEIRIESLTKEVFTKEELAKQEFDKLSKKSKTELENATKERDTWKAKHDGLTIKTALFEAASEHKAVQNEQIFDLLSGKAKIVPVLDADGKETGNLQVKIPVKAKQKDKIVELELPASDALKTMRENPELYGNLFRYEGSSGTGLPPNSGGGGVAPENETDEQYFARRFKK